MSLSPVIKDLTEGSVDGTGVYDVIMSAVKGHLRLEFDAERIRGTDYANAYVQATISALGESIQFTVSQSRLSGELAQMAAQTDKTRQEIISLELANRLAEEKHGLELETMRVNIDNSKKDLELKEVQLALSEKELEIKGQQLEMAKQELSIKIAQLGIAEQDLLIKKEQLLLTKYELTTKLPAEVALVKTQDALYAQKTITERAQTNNQGVGPGSVIDLSNALLREQAKAYVSNANQTAAKLLIDTWNVRHTNDPDGNRADATNRLTDANIGIAVSKIL